MLDESDTRQPLVTSPRPGKDAAQGDLGIDLLSINTIKMLAVDAVQRANSGHPGTPMALAPVAYLLWTEIMRFNPANPSWAGRDRFVLSAGHASMLIYGLLHLTGFDLKLEDLKRFRQLHSRTAGHPERGLTPGVETTTGPLGQGFGNAVGMAIAQKQLAARFSRDDFDLFDSGIYVICSDGDLMEGVSSEAASLAGHLRLDNLVYVYDNNHITIDGATDLAFSENVADRFVAYGWRVWSLGDDASLDDIRMALRAADQCDRPALIVLRTHIADGSPNAHDTSAAHGAPLGEEEVRLTRENLGWPDRDFWVPEEVYDHMGQAKERGLQWEQQWNDLLGAYSEKYPELAAQWSRQQAGRLPEGWNADLPQWSTADESIATRAASGKVLNALVEQVPELIGGSADLAGSTGSKLVDQGDFSACDRAGRNLHFGVREHSMGTVLNGVMLFGGLRVFGSTFLIFSDYMRPTIRLAAMMGLPVIYLFSHDSIWLGEDGPTHQPVEHLAALRAVPNLTVIRPADANETAFAWQCALLRSDGPTALALSRQKLPNLTTVELAAGLRRGAYVISASDSSEPDLVVLATGSEVHVALSAKEVLAKDGHDVRVVSIPSWELFDAQDESYRENVLPSGACARLSVEAAVKQGWERYLGPHGVAVSLERFGESAPADQVAADLGFDAQRVAAAGREAISRAAQAAGSRG